MAKKKVDEQSNEHVDASGVEEGTVASNNTDSCTDKHVTEYGEFVSTEFHWLPPDEQKKRAKKLGKELR
ncbi:MAG: hypothetical protein LBI03_04535, partial [Clostridiales bacterium]|nr:hypothetical protein [Clostridiales bacterium]